jgi:hypothetical protein
VCRALRPAEAALVRRAGRRSSMHIAGFVEITIALPSGDDALETTDSLPAGADLLAAAGRVAVIGRASRAIVRPGRQSVSGNRQKGRGHYNKLFHHDLPCRRQFTCSKGVATPLCGLRLSGQDTGCASISCRQAGAFAALPVAKRAAKARSETNA